MRYLILAQSECTAAALGAWLEVIGETVPPPGSPNRMVIKPYLPQRDGGADVYHRLIEQIERVIERPSFASHGDIVALVDSVRPSGLSVIREGMDWDHLIALLILTFPEVKWLFGLVSGVCEGFPIEGHALVSLITKARRDPLLDPTGLREWVRERTNESLNEQRELTLAQDDAMTLPKRHKFNLAAAIDEEEDYAVVHAYTAYRHGFRADIVTTAALMKELFAKSTESHGYCLLMEDVRLQFPDKENSVHLSRLESNPGQPGRDYHCPLLHRDRDDSLWRILITSGQAGFGDPLVRENDRDLEDKPYGAGATLFKPVGGICDLWRRMGVKSDLMRNGGGSRGNAPGFYWPPEPLNDDVLDGHGAPGKLGMVARALLKRAEDAMKSASSASEWIRAALLASDAAELLGGRTPTMTLVALAVKHECEVRAECSFLGAGFHFGLRDRLEEIQSEVKAISRRFHQGVRSKAEKDARASMINRLRMVFSASGQMEEEEGCLIELRSLNRKMSRPSGWLHFTIVHWLAHLLLGYGEWLLGSFARLITMTAVWMAAIAMLTRTKNSNFYEIVSTVIGWFFGGNAAAAPPELFGRLPMFGSAPEPMIHYLSWLAVAAGVFHVGIFMSYLYSLISRR